MRFGGVFVMMSSDSSSSSDDDDGRADLGDEQDQRLREHPAEDAAGAGEHGHALARLGLAAEEVAEAGHGEEQQAEADADAGVVVHRARVPEQPDREQQHDDGQRERDPAEESAEGPRVERLGDGVVDEEPLDDGAGDREHDDEERQAVAALLLGERLGAERACRPAGDVREPHPGAHEQRRAVRRRRLGLRRPRMPRAVDAGSFFVGAVLEPEPRAGVPEARPFDLVLVAMRPTLRPTGDAGRQDAASVRDRRTARDGARGDGCRARRRARSAEQAHHRVASAARCRRRRTPRSGRGCARSCRAPRSA